MGSAGQARLGYKTIVLFQTNPTTEVEERSRISPATGGCGSELSRRLGIGGQAMIDDRQQPVPTSPFLLPLTGFLFGLVMAKAMRRKMMAGTTRCADRGLEVLHGRHSRAREMNHGSVVMCRRRLFTT